MTGAAKRSGPVVPETVLAALGDSDSDRTVEERQPEPTGS
jgi:hypothetical protein